ncbi:MAG: hypothetical protein KDA27_27825, partial [Candidatus Eisenbacteria bacterium]|nr:hypothetical protein [Candidatus Eisenbacteria bacterium]
VGIGSLGDPGTIVLDADMAEDGTNLVVAVRTFTPAQDPTGLSAPVGGGAIEQVSMRTGAVTKSMEFDSRIESIAREPGGSRVAFGSVGSVGVIDLEEGRELLQRGDPRATDRDIGRVAWSPDGRWIGAAVMHDDIQIWDAANYEVVARGMGHDDLIWSVGFDPTSRYLATTSEDGTVRIWSVPDGRELHHLTGHGRSTLCARFQPDGSRLATGGRDARILIWRTDTFDRVASLEGHGNYVFDLEWTSDGSRLLSSSGDGTVRVWETTSLAERRDATIERAQIVADLESGDSTMVGADSGSAEPASDGAVASASASSGATSSLSSREQEVVWQFQLRKQLELHEARTIAN